MKPGSEEGPRTEQGLRAMESLRRGRIPPRTPVPTGEAPEKDRADAQLSICLNLRFRIVDSREVIVSFRFASFGFDRFQ